MVNENIQRSIRYGYFVASDSEDSESGESGEFAPDSPPFKFARKAPSSKARPCDNAKGSSHNKATARHERMDCDTPDFPARAAAAFRRATQGTPEDGVLEMKAGTDDLADAYRRVPDATV